MPGSQLAHDRRGVHRHTVDNNTKRLGSLNPGMMPSALLNSGTPLPAKGEMLNGFAT